MKTCKGKVKECLCSWTSAKVKKVFSWVLPFVLFIVIILLLVFFTPGEELPLATEIVSENPQPRYQPISPNQDNTPRVREAVPDVD